MHVPPVPAAEAARTSYDAGRQNLATGCLLASTLLPHSIPPSACDDRRCEGQRTLPCTGRQIAREESLLSSPRTGMRPADLPSHTACCRATWPHKSAPFAYALPISQQQAGPQRKWVWSRTEHMGAPRAQQARSRSVSAATDMACVSSNLQWRATKRTGGAEAGQDS
jgi:hypothetical protein